MVTHYHGTLHMDHSGFDAAGALEKVTILSQGINKSYFNCIREFDEAQTT